MALIPCTECNTPVSDTATRCPSCAHVLRKPRRSFFGKLCKWSFVLFNVLMAFWLFSYWGSVGGALNEGSEAARAGAAIGATMGTGMLLVIWALGDIILGSMVLFTRPKP